MCMIGISLYAITADITLSLFIQAEEDYKLFPGRSPYVNLRGDHLVGTLIRDLLMNEEILYEVVLALFMGPHQDARIAAARVLLAASHLYSDKAPPVIFQMFHEEVSE